MKIMEKQKTIIIGIIVVIIILICAICAYSLSNQNKEVLQINDLNIEQDQFGIYNLKGHITPLKDFDYLEARVVIYDSNVVVIGKSSCAWNSAHVKKDDTLSVGNGLGVTCDGDPAYAVISFFDNVYSEEELANFTVTFNDNATNNTDSSTATSSTPTTSNDNDKKYTQEDIDKAKDDAYQKGYDDYYYDSELNAYYDSNGKIIGGQNDGANYEDMKNNQPEVDSEGNLI